MKKWDQIKSKERVAKYGEVFTNEREVNAMLDWVKPETERISARFLDPTCWNGNFLIEILVRKLYVINNRYSKNQINWEIYTIIGISNIYGVDILIDNIEECRLRLFNFFEENYKKNFWKKIKLEYIKSIQFLLSKNIIWWDTLSGKIPNWWEELFIMSEWAMLNRKVIRREFIFKHLEDPKYQEVVLDEKGNKKYFNKPVKMFPLVDLMELYKQNV